MTRIIMLFLLVPFSTGVWGQTFDEWFQQKKTQLDYLRQQIAALQTYMKTTEDGYGIVQRGTEGITGVKKEDYSLHSGYFESLENVRPAITRYPVIGAAVRLQNQLIELATETNAQAEALSGWSGTVAAFFRGMLADCSTDLDILMNLATDGQVQMTDAERLTAIDRLYRRMKERYIAGIQVREAVIFLQKNLLK
jgi:hypothetical protein